MASDVRTKMIESAVVLLAKHGLQATSFTEVLDASGAPRGSVYHHFPEGKDQLVAAAIDLAGARAIALLDALVGKRADEVTAGFLAMWRAVLVRSRFTAGCSVVAVTVATDTPSLLERAGAIFRTWHATLARLLEDGGMERKRASSFATLLIAASEGAVVLARAEASAKPFDTVSEQLLADARRLVP